MPIPDYETLMHPLLKIASDGKVRTIRDIVEILGKEFSLSEQELDTMLPSGQSTFYNRVHWASLYLVKAGLLERPERGKLRITKEGKSILAKPIMRLDSKFLTQFPEFMAFQRARKLPKKDDSGKRTAIDEEVQHSTPEEQISQGFHKIQDSLAHDLLTTTKSCSPRFFERLVVDLLLKMGYGGTLAEAGKVIGKSGDGGIDGVIKEDKLGLDVIYLQAKRWEGTVSAGAVRDFSGSLDYHGAKKGVFITTSSFTADAKNFVTKIGEKKIVLIDGYELAQLMIDHDVGVTTIATYAIKKMDTDYFEEE